MLSILILITLAGKVLKRKSRVLLNETREVGKNSETIENLRFSVKIEISEYRKKKKI